MSRVGLHVRLFAPLAVGLSEQRTLDKASSIAQGVSGTPHFKTAMGLAHTCAMDACLFITVAQTAAPLSQASTSTWEA